VLSVDLAISSIHTYTMPRESDLGDTHSDFYSCWPVTPVSGRIFGAPSLPRTPGHALPMLLSAHVMAYSNSNSRLRPVPSASNSATKTS
jgi:hypothetical protein